MNDITELPLPEQDYEVVITVTTHNHEKYISKTIESILAQKADFSYVLLVIDDCSEDGTCDIIRSFESSYPDIVKGIYLKQNHYHNALSIEGYIQPWRDRSKYQALCDGDDYWIDNKKLQKQVIFMRNHPDCVLCFHNAVEHWEDESKQDKIFSDVQDREYSGVEILEEWIIPTSSCLARTEVSKGAHLLDIMANPAFVFHDIALFLFCGTIGSIYGMKEAMSVYLRNYNSDSQTIGRLSNNTVEMNQRLCNHYMEIINVFESKYGKNLANICLNNFHKHNAQAAKVAIDQKKIKILIHLFFISIKNSKWVTLKCYYPLLKYAIYRMGLEFLGIDLVRFKHFLKKK